MSGTKKRVVPLTGFAFACPASPPANDVQGSLATAEEQPAAVFAAG
jgi:hypothetical protein